MAGKVNKHRHKKARKAGRKKATRNTASAAQPESFEKLWDRMKRSSDEMKKRYEELRRLDPNLPDLGGHKTK